MRRLVITTVGTSLLDENRNRNRLAGSVRPLGVLTRGIASVNRRFRRVLDDIHRKENADQSVRARTVERYSRYSELADRVPEQRVASMASAVVEGMLALWSAQSVTSEQQRSASPAELASLSLLDPPLGPGDNLVLLYSDTPAGAFCAACLEELFRQGMTGLTADGEPVPVETKRVAWLDPERKETFEQRAVGYLAEALTDSYYAPRTLQPEQTLFNITGGYKAATPIITLVAGLLGDVWVVCLFERSEALLYQPVMPISIASEKLAQILLDAGTGDAGRDVLAQADSARKMQDTVEKSWRIYFADSGLPALSSLGLAVRAVLEAQRRGRGRRTL